MYNNLSDSVNDYVRFSQTEMDPYSEIQYAWTFVRENRVANFQVQGKQDPASLETLESVFFTFQDPEFPDRGKTRSVLIPATGRRLKFTFWLQPGKAPVVYIVPGLGSHRLAETSAGVGRAGLQQRVLGSKHQQPVQLRVHGTRLHGGVPAYMPVDGHDLHVALTEIDHRLEQLVSGPAGRQGADGLLHGRIPILFAATEPSNRMCRTRGVCAFREQGVKEVRIAPSQRRR